VLVASSVAAFFTVIDIQESVSLLADEKAFSLALTAWHSAVLTLLFTSLITSVFTGTDSNHNMCHEC